MLHRIFAILLAAVLREIDVHILLIRVEQRAHVAHAADEVVVARVARERLRRRLQNDAEISPGRALIRRPRRPDARVALEQQEPGE